MHGISQLVAGKLMRIPKYSYWPYSLNEPFPISSAIGDLHAVARIYARICGRNWGTEKIPSPFVRRQECVGGFCALILAIESSGPWPWAFMGLLQRVSPALSLSISLGKPITECGNVKEESPRVARRHTGLHLGKWIARVRYKERGYGDPYERRLWLHLQHLWPGSEPHGPSFKENPDESGS